MFIAGCSSASAHPPLAKASQWQIPLASLARDGNFANKSLQYLPCLLNMSTRLVVNVFSHRQHWCDNKKSREAQAGNCTGTLREQASQGKLNSTCCVNKQARDAAPQCCRLNMAKRLMQATLPRVQVASQAGQAAARRRAIVPECCLDKQAGEAHARGCAGMLPCQAGQGDAGYCCGAVVASHATCKKSGGQKIWNVLYCSAHKPMSWLHPRKLSPGDQTETLSNESPERSEVRRTT